VSRDIRRVMLNRLEQHRGNRSHYGNSRVYWPEFLNTSLRERLAEFDKKERAS
jgi:hypothetical protein